MNKDKIIKKNITIHPKHRYRIDIINDDTYEDVSTIHFTRFKFIVFSILIFIIINTLTISAIVFTPIRYYIPGYGGVSSRNELTELKVRYDSLENSLHQHDTYFRALKDILGAQNIKKDTSLQIKHNRNS